MIIIGIIIWKSTSIKDGHNDKGKFLTVRWNNFLTLGLGLILLFYVAVIVSTSVLSDLAPFIGLSVIGGVY
jgi:hypothetical protein